MKCKKQFRFHKIPIANLWEVHLDIKLWKRLCIAALDRGCSISWITRYCVFRIARKRVKKMPFAMKIHSNELKNTHHQAEKYHRHILCLYGDDEKLLRLTAMQLGVTVSHLIRLALYWFLPKVEKMRVDWNQIYYHGTRICRFLDISRKNMHKIPFYDTLFYTKWPIESWWKRPRYTLPIPYSPAETISNFYRYIQPPESDYRRAVE
jgi:hypothetical protein